MDYVAIKEDVHTTESPKIIENLPHKYGDLANHNVIQGNEVIAYDKVYSNYEESLPQEPWRGL